jgi:prolyl 4-hydroxylase
VSATPHQDLRHFIRVYDDALPPAWCTRLLKGFDALGAHTARNGRELRAGLEDSAWTELNVTRHGDPLTAGFFRTRIDEALARYNADVRLEIPVPNSPAFADLVMKRYRPNAGGQPKERFQLHFDAINHLANRYVVLLWYLNDVERGGGTRFPQLGVDIEARAGRLLMFPPYWMYQHEGLPPESGDKFILSTYLLFTAAPA